MNTSINYKMQNCYQIGVFNDFTFELLIWDALLGVKNPNFPNSIPKRTKFSLELEPRTRTTLEAPLLGVSFNTVRTDFGACFYGRNPWDFPILYWCLIVMEHL